ncbi:MAG: damage-inducible protein DinB [Candidatus Pacebacteria bacterium]|nr:damage-inducible protein DinB [Candidatus Paceibacterota bacterium]
MTKTIAQLFLKEFIAEEKSTRKCLERIPTDIGDWKPHQKSMRMDYLALLVADIPKWIAAMLEVGEINFATWDQYTTHNLGDVVKIFDENMAAAKKALENADDETLASKTFFLKSGDNILMQDPMIESLSSTLNHWVHHRGQLSVYMRLKDIAVPSIYGPSADEPNF